MPGGRAILSNESTPGAPDACGARRVPARSGNRAGAIQIAGDQGEHGESPDQAQHVPAGFLAPMGLADHLLDHDAEQQAGREGQGCHAVSGRPAEQQPVAQGHTQKNGDRQKTRQKQAPLRRCTFLPECGDGREAFRDIGRNLGQGQQKTKLKSHRRAGPDHDAVAEQIDRDPEVDQPGDRTAALSEFALLRPLNESVHREEENAAGHEGEAHRPHRPGVQRSGHQLDADDRQNDACRHVQCQAEALFGNCEPFGHPPAGIIVQYRERGQSEHPEIVVHSALPAAGAALAPDHVRQARGLAGSGFLQHTETAVGLQNHCRHLPG